MNIRYTLILILLLPTSWSMASEGPVEYYCTPDNVEFGECQMGDLIIVLSADDASKECDFDKKVIPYSSGDNFICYYRGSERVHRKK